MSILLDSCMDILEEAYYGKPKEFELIEKKLAKIIKVIRDVREGRDTKTDINKMKEVQEIEQILTKFFKNKETHISFYAPILPSNAYNAFTFPTSMGFFKKDKNDKKRARPEDLFINVNIDIGLVYGLELTPGELMAIILHEIGHQFDASLFAVLSKINIKIVEDVKDRDFSINVPESIKQSAFGVITMFIVGGLSKPIALLYKFVNKLTTMSATFARLLSIFMTAFADVGMFLSKLRTLKRLTSIFNLPGMLKDALQPYSLFGYAGEKFADSFATSYGYGPDAQTVFSKFETKKGLFLNENIAKIPVLNIGYDLLKCTAQTASLLTDPHPNNATRIQSQLNKLKRDIQDPNLKPEIRKELEENIKEMEDYVNNVVLNVKSDMNRGRWISFCWNYVMIKVFKGKADPRELFEIAFKHEL